MVALVTNFENMKDKPEGISKAVFHKRLSRILADSPDLDAGEVENLATFIFDSTAVYSAHEGVVD